MIWRLIGGTLAALAVLPLCAGTDARLVEAAKRRDVGAIRTLLAQRADVNGTEPDGATALHWAARWDDVETASLLIRGGANVKAQNRYQVQPLSLAATNGSAPMIALLLKSGADPNSALPGGETALMTAARTGKVPAVKELLAKGANVNAKEQGRGQTAVMWAAAEGNTQVVELLKEYGADLRARSQAGFTPLLFAARDGRIESVRALLRSGADVHEVLPESHKSKNANALILAVANGHFDVATVLLDAGAKDNADLLGWTLLHQITWIRKTGGGSNALPIPGSGKMTSLEFVREVVKRGADVNARITRKPYALGTTTLNVLGATPLLMAARTADAPLMRLLIELGADTRTTTNEGTNVLLIAAGVGTQQYGEDPGTEEEVFEAVKVALELGGDINAIDKNGETVIHGAAYKEVSSVAQYLIDHGAKIEVWNKKNKLGWTPLRISEGVTRGQNVRHRSPATAAVIRQAMVAANASTELEPDRPQPAPASK